MSSGKTAGKNGSSNTAVGNRHHKGGSPKSSSTFKGAARPGGRAGINAVPSGKGAGVKARPGGPQGIPGRRK